MKTVTTIHLNGRAYQVEDEAYKALSAYLADTAKALAENPDKDEILADFEQAVAEKFAKYLSPSKNVVTEKEVETIIAEMGPVEGSGAQSESAEAGAAAEPGAKRESGEAQKRLYRIHEGALFAGVCTGLAAYFNVDVVLVRIGFVLLGVITHGGAALAYFIMMMVVPKAGTSEERAQAAGKPFTAQDFIDQAKITYAEFKTDKRGWKRHMREQKKYWKYKAKDAAREGAQAFHMSPVAPILRAVSMIVTVAWVVVFVRLIQTHAIFGWALPASVPLWAAIVVFFCLLNIILLPLRLAKRGYYWQSRTGSYMATYHHGPFEAITGMIWFAAMVLLCYLAYTRIPFVHYNFDHLGQWIDSHVLHRMR